MKVEKLANQQKNYENFLLIFIFFYINVFCSLPAILADKIFMGQMRIDQINLHKKKSYFYLKQQLRNMRLYCLYIYAFCSLTDRPTDIHPLLIIQQLCYQKQPQHIILLLELFKGRGVLECITSIIVVDIICVKAFLLFQHKCNSYQLINAKLMDELFQMFLFQKIITIITSVQFGFS